MHLKSVQQMGALMLHFRNGWTLVQAMRSGQLCHEVVLWDGTRISHPAGRAGLLEAVIELWVERTYTEGFYRSADGDVIVDAGANVGLFSVWMARRNRKCRVIALEPFAENFACLKANVARACPRNVTCCETALGGEFGRGRMRSVGKRSLDHLLQTSSNGGEIDVVPLAALFDLAHANQIDFLKVDIEGSENRVFAAAPPEVISRFKRIAMEYHDQIAPGTLDLLRRVLAPSHDLTVRPGSFEGCGILLARRRDVA